MYATTFFALALTGALAGPLDIPTVSVCQKDKQTCLCVALLL